jgi:pantoate--beta-alanine ligase
MIVARTIAEARAALRELPRPLGFTPTMGALHEGHLSLVDAARARCAAVAASIFVNPTQFGRGEDLAKYPRDESRDLGLLEARGVDVVFAPEADEMYPEGFATQVHVGGALTEQFEGASRPSHFDGVAVIVVKLLGVVRPDVLLLGQKDAQQLAVVRRFVRDLDLPVEAVAVPTVREADGLAMSSRNAYLTPDERAAAPGLYRALLVGAATAESGEPADDVVTVTARALLSSSDANASLGAAAPLDEHTPFDVEYVAVVDADGFEQLHQTIGPRSLLVAAVRLGSTRLIDNIPLIPSAYPAEDATT